MPIRIAVSGAGSLFGQGILKALKMSTLQYRVTALDFFPFAVGLYWTESAYLMPDILSPQVSENDYLERLIAILKREEIDIMFVGTEFELPLLAKHKEMIEKESGSKVVVSRPEVIEIGDDKWATCQFLKTRRFPYPDSLIDLTKLDEFVGRVGFPLIVKPRRGSRSRGVSLLRSPADLDAAIKLAGPEPIIQEAVGSIDAEYTCGAVVLGGQCQGVIALRRNLKDGNTIRAYLESYPEIEALVEKIALELNPEGPVNVQLRVGKKGAAVFEINTRYSGTTVIRALAGFNEVEAVARWVLWGERLALTRRKSGVVLRYWEEQLVPFGDYERLSSLAPI
ncbi:MAG: ATP-grasp domain-containing protein [Elusimicrobia bacterium]|nr:ATP-grasp domain-containing protein [Elusimicrobiota bacterium]